MTGALTRRAWTISALAAALLLALVAIVGSSIGAARRMPVPRLVAGFEDGLAGFNLSGVGEVVPQVIPPGDPPGDASCRFVLRGGEDRSELVLGGRGSYGDYGTVDFEEGSEAWFGFSVLVRKMVYGRPGAHNLIMQFKSEGTGSPNFGLQLWDVDGNRGLWTGGPSQEVDHGGERFLAPFSPQHWHRIEIHFRASSQREGFYQVFLDGRLVDRHRDVSMIVPRHESAYIKTGLYRNGGEIPGKSVLLLDSVKLGPTRVSVAG
ncbi:MAG: heparin lyase I family protein [Solirubrobacterales bacterium]